MWGLWWMIRSIWVIDRISGRCLFERSYGKDVHEADFIPSFLSALTSFSDSELQGDRISVLETKGRRWIYRYYDPLIFVVTGAKGDPESHLKAQVSYLCSSFLDAFPQLKGEQAENFLKGWSGATSDFHSFVTLADQLVHQWGEISQINKAAKSLDVLEIYQKIFDAILTGIPPRNQRIWPELRQAVDEFSTQNAVTVNYKLSEPDPSLDLMSIDVFSIPYESLKTSLGNLLEKLVLILKRNLQSGEAAKILHSQVIPIMKRDYKRIDVYGLNRVLVSLL
jgi:hypothetical protein